MNCIECEDLLAAYATGDLQGERAEACSLHLEECRSCRESLEFYVALVNSIADSPAVETTAIESANLYELLRKIDLPSPYQPRRTWRYLLERIALAAMSIVAFVVIALSTWAVRSGRVSLSALTSPIVIVLGIVIVIFVTSFLPIAITARRRPLNGATFRR